MFSNASIFPAPRIHHSRTICQPNHLPDSVCHNQPEWTRRPRRTTHFWTIDLSTSSKGIPQRQPSLISTRDGCIPTTHQTLSIITVFILLRDSQECARRIRSFLDWKAKPNFYVSIPVPFYPNFFIDLLCPLFSVHGQLCSCVLLHFWEQCNNILEQYDHRVVVVRVHGQAYTWFFENANDAKNGTVLRFVLEWKNSILTKCENSLCYKLLSHLQNCTFKLFVEPKGDLKRRAEDR